MFRPRHHDIEDRECGLRAFVVIDDTSCGPAAGGIRTCRYPNETAARADAAALARAMTYKCALAGLPAGGGKGVVMLLDTIDRPRAFERLGEFVDSLGGRFITAGDLGTTVPDLEAMARRTEHVYIDEAGLAEAVGRGCVRAIQACVVERGGDDADLSGVHLAVQGCGTVGAAVARAASRLGADVSVADVDDAAAQRLAAEVAGHVVAADGILEIEADVVAPCAVGGVLTAAVAGRVRAGAVCGAANNILAAPDVEETLRERGITWVPDVVSSSGAVILGVGRRIMGRHDCDELVDRVFDTAQRVIVQARERKARAGDVARELAEHRIREARGER